MTKRTTNGAWRRMLRLSAAALVLVPAGLRAGTVIEVKTTYFGVSRPDESATIRLDDRGARFDAIEDGRETALIFVLDDHNQPKCWVLDKKSLTYVELSLPDAAEGGPAEPGPQVQFRKVASGVKIGDRQCVQYESTVRGEKKEDLWTTAAKNLSVTDRQLGILRKMGEFFSRISSETNAFFQVGRPPGEGGFDGFPVLVVEYEGGRKLEKSEVTAARGAAIDPDVFALPKGARRIASPGR